MTVLRGRSFRLSAAGEFGRGHLSGEIPSTTFLGMVCRFPVIGAGIQSAHGAQEFEYATNQRSVASAMGMRLERKDGGNQLFAGAQYGCQVRQVRIPSQSAR